ncbi:ABC-2 family transporter protein [Glycomyces sp. NPDC046736]|uniref:ABC transporter permease n=1 Tax=Glycomyces sp. NPDC046736 TaxID=3155615 RepID=UPI0033FB9A48
MAAEAISIRHAAGVYRRSIGAYLRSMAEYPADFWVMAVSGIFWQATLFGFIGVLFGNITTLGGWGYHEMLLLAGFLSVTGSSTALLWDGIWDVGKLIVEGDLDYRLTRPAPVLIQVGSKHVGMQAFGEMTMGTLMIVIGWTGAGLGLAQIPVALLLLLCGFVIQGALLTLANTANFWMKGRMPVVAFMLIELQLESMRFPLTVFPIAVRIGLTFVLPLAFASFVPVQILIGELDPLWLLAPPAAAALTGWIAALVFRLGLRAYDSAGH